MSYCNGNIGGYSYIVMPGASVLHLCDPRSPMRSVETNGRTQHIPDPACRNATYAAGRFEATRENERKGRRVCKVCIKRYQGYVAMLANQIHGATMILRGW